MKKDKRQGEHFLLSNPQSKINDGSKQLYSLSQQEIKLSIEKRHKEEKLVHQETIEVRDVTCCVFYQK